MSLYNRGTSYYAVLKYRLLSVVWSAKDNCGCPSEPRISKLRKEKRLFPELRVNARGHYSDDISKWFGRFLDSLNKGIKAKADKFEEGHVFHSFRHTVRTEFRNNEANPEFVTRIQGWKRGSSLSEHYGEVSLKVLRETVNCKLKYDGLDLSHLYRE